MSGEVLIYVASALTGLWGIAHLIPTKSVVAGFGDISLDNKRIITMEWITEGIALIFLGVLATVVTLVAPGSAAASAVYLVSAGALVVLALVSLFTGYKVSFLPFKLCPYIFSASAILLLIGAYR